MIYIALFVWLIGIVLSYGRFLGAVYEHEEDMLFTDNREPWGLDLRGDPSNVIIQLIICLSWLSFLIMVVHYFLAREKYFFKWSITPLRKEWEKLNEQR